MRLTGFEPAWYRLKVDCPSARLQTHNYLDFLHFRFCFRFIVIPPSIYITRIFSWFLRNTPSEIRTRENLILNQACMPVPPKGLSAGEDASKSKISPACPVNTGEGIRTLKLTPLDPKSSLCSSSSTPAYTRTDSNRH